MKRGDLPFLLTHGAAVIFLSLERKAYTALYILGAAATLAGTVLVVTKARRESPQDSLTPPGRPGGGG